MITLNSDRGLEQITDCNEIHAIAGFRSDIDPQMQKLEAVIGNYHCTFDIRCGLSNCHTRHRRGYIVKTKIGLITHIGKDCGKNYFGVDFEIMARQLERDITEKNNRSRLKSLHSKIEDIESHINNLRKNEGGDHVYKLNQQLFVNPVYCPSVIQKKLSNMVKERSGILSVEREATAIEMASLEASGARIEHPHYISERIANIEGISALYPENNIRDILVFNLEKGVKELKQSDPDTSESKLVQRIVMWGDAVEIELDKASAAIRAGKSLLTIGNLSPLGRLLSTHAEHHLWEKFLGTVPQHWS